MLETLTSYFTDTHVWAFLAATPIIVIGFVGTILPVLPGTVLIYAGFVLFGLITGFDSLGWSFYMGQLFLVGISYLVDFLASAYGVKIYGGSKAAMWGGIPRFPADLCYRPLGSVCWAIARRDCRRTVGWQRGPQCLPCRFRDIYGPARGNNHQTHDFLRDGWLVCLAGYVGPFSVVLLF